MKIVRNYYTELKEELLECRAAEGTAIPADAASDDELADLLEHLAQAERFRLLKKAADGQSMSEAAFKQISDRALETAERLGLNITVETRGLNGVISFRTPRLRLNAANDQIHISRLLSFLTRADHMLFNVVPEDGEMLLQISLCYELTL